MRRKSGSLKSNGHRGIVPRALWAVFLAATLLSPHAALAADEECDVASTIFASPANNLCVPAIATTANFTIDAFDTEWAAGTFYDHTEYFTGGGQQARVRISRKATGVNKSDLFLFFDVTGDSVSAGLDEIRIGLNPGTTPANSTLIKLHPFPVGPTPAKETFTFNAGTGTWNSAGNGDPWLPPANVAVRQNVPGATWFAEVKISLNAIPTNPITAADFRLHLELFANDGVSTINYQWPAQYGFVGLHDFICANPQRWHPMSFSTGAGGNCPHPDLNIANGLYSCDAIYILRNGMKSREIAVGQSNEFHADVTNPGPGNAPDTQVYLTLMKLGISTGPIAMNYSHTDASIVSFFNDHFGAWMAATDSLDTGTPKPPTLFTVNSGTTDTAFRFNWRPSDETRFGPPAGFVDSHRCTAAFVNFKDDPNFANNFSFCNTSIVACPTGQICLMAFSIGQFYPYLRPRDGTPARIIINAINEPFEGWLNRGQFKFDGEGIEQVRGNVYQVRVPEKGEVPIKFSFTPPPVNKGAIPSTGGLVPTAQAAAAQTRPGEGGGSDPIKERNERLRKIYGGRPLIVIEGFVPTTFETGLDKERKEQLFAPSSYVAFALEDKPAGGGGEEGGGGGKGKGKCGTGTIQGFAFASLFTLVGLTLVWRRSRRRTRKGGTRREG